MLHAALRTLVKIVLASLVVGTILAHFGVTPQQVIGATGLSAAPLDTFTVSRKRRTCPSFCFIAFPDGEPVPTSPGNALFLVAFPDG